MTAPTAGDITTQVPFTVPAGGLQVQVSDGGNSPVGAMLINRGDNGGTIWVQAGPSGGAAVLPIGPGGSLRWTDRGQVPYAKLATSSTLPETLILTNKSADYSNPVVVAAATAAQLAVQGIPSTFMDGNVFDGQISAGGQTGLLNVGGYASLIVSVAWPQPTPQSTDAINLVFTDAALPAFPSVVLPCSMPNQVSQEQGVWQVPVYSPTLRVRNMNRPSGAAYVTVIGTNRSAPAFRQLGDDGGVHTLAANYTGNTSITMLAWNNNGYTVNLSPLTRFNGRVQMVTYAQNAGVVRMNYVTPDGLDVLLGYPVPQGDSIVEINHPRSSAVYWSFLCNTNTAGFVRCAFISQDY